MYCTFNRRFVKDFSHIAALLHNLMTHEAVFKWAEKAEATLNSLKAAIGKPPVLAFKEKRKHFVVHTDASKRGLRAALMKLLTAIG